jgi:hypothetical protein
MRFDTRRILGLICVLVALWWLWSAARDLS